MTVVEETASSPYENNPHWPLQRLYEKVNNVYNEMNDTPYDGFYPEDGNSSSLENGGRSCSECGAGLREGEPHCSKCGTRNERVENEAATRSVQSKPSGRWEIDRPIIVLVSGSVRDVAESKAVVAARRRDGKQPVPALELDHEGNDRVSYREVTQGLGPIDDKIDGEWGTFPGAVRADSDAGADLFDTGLENVTWSGPESTATFFNEVGDALTDERDVAKALDGDNIWLVPVLAKRRTTPNEDSDKSEESVGTKAYCKSCDGDTMFRVRGEVYRGPGRGTVPLWQCTGCGTRTQGNAGYQ